MSDLSNDTANQPTTKRSNGVKRFVLLLLIPTLLIVAGFFVYLHGGRIIETDNAYVKADKVPISPEISGVVKHVSVRENQWVEEGDLLFSLDPEPFEVAVAKAEAKLAQVTTDLQATKASYYEKQAEVELAKTKYNFALREEKRQANLVNDHFISASNFDQAQQNVQLTRQQIDVIESELRSLATKLGGSIDSPIEQHPSYRTALAELAQAKLDLTRVQVKAAEAGVVSNLPEKGEYVKAGNSAMVLVTTGDIWIEANFPETDLTYMEPGQLVEIFIDTYPNQKWTGSIESLSPATGAEFSIIPAQNATGNWVKISQRVPVRIRLDSISDKPQLRVGFSAVVKVDTEHRRQLFGMGG